MPSAVALRKEVCDEEPLPSPALRLVGLLPPSPLAGPDVTLISAIADLNARRLLRLGSIRRDDFEDLTQEFVTEALTCWPWFDQRRSAAATFMTLVMRRRASSMIRTRRAVKRGGDRHAIPFDRAAESFEDDSFRKDLDRALLRLDVCAVVARLPRHLQRLCHALMANGLSVAARTLQIPRHVAIRQLALIRKHFVTAGLQP
jgi:DNA-directed RNA polymerase specialized sigma24 family protein